ncbi:MAG: hypothetical protein JNJ89_07855 [Rubrivivax sp.]|nr:hypothetical protein [Rubrivivax sp.]
MNAALISSAGLLAGASSAAATSASAGGLAWMAGAVVLATVATALVLRPWRLLHGAAPPWPWLAWCAALPWLWSADRLSAVPAVQPLPGACLLLLMAGWPLATLAFVPAAAATAWLAQLSLAEALERLLWLGTLPAGMALALGAAVRRWLPRHLFVYILARGFVVTVLANMAAGTAQALAQPVPGGLSLEDLLLARWLAGWGDAVITGMIVAVFVAFRPQWLATYADHLYLPPATSRNDHRSAAAPAPSPPTPDPPRGEAP